MSDGGETSSEGPGPALVVVLEDLAETRRSLERLEWSVVELVRRTGATWDEVGELLGISRQAARQRFSKPKPRRGAD